MRAIAMEIRLDVDAMKDDPKSPWAIAYLDTDFAYQNDRHSVDRLILIGWLLCSHWSDETQSRELWHIVNPALEEVVPKADVINTIASLLYVAVNLNKKLLKGMPESEEKTKALSYLDTCTKNRKRWMSELTQELDDEVTGEQLIELIKPFFRSYDLRMSIAGDTKGEQQAEE